MIDVFEKSFPDSLKKISLQDSKKDSLVSAHGYILYRYLYFASDSFSKSRRTSIKLLEASFSFCVPQISSSFRALETEDPMTTKCVRTNVQP